MKDILTRNALAVFDLAAALRVDMNLAPAMFASNLSLYPTEGIIHEGAHVDYDALSAEWAGMTKAERIEAKNAFTALMKNKYHDLGNAYAAGDRETFDRILEGFRHGA